MRKMENLQAINSLITGNHNPEVLEKYTGFGGIGRELSEYDYFKKLNTIITKSEIAKIKATAKTAYYTPAVIYSSPFRNWVRQTSRFMFRHVLLVHSSHSPLASYPILEML